MQTLTTIIVAFVSAFLGAGLSYLSTTRLERRRDVRRKEAAGVLLQAELVHIRLALSEHHRFMEGFAAKTAFSIGNVKHEGEYVSYHSEQPFLFRSLVSDIGLFDAELSYQIVYCYKNLDSFLSSQQRFVADLPTLLFHSELASEAQNLAATENALITQISNVLPQLGKQSRPIPQ